MVRSRTETGTTANRGGAAAFPPGARRLALAGVLMLAGLDLATIGLCPLAGADCLYGLFTLLAGPVVLAGLAGAVIPRLARRPPVRAALLLGGAVVLAAIVIGGHVAAVHWLNGAEYGGVWLRPRLLAVGLGLAGAYYAGQAAIALMRPRRDRD
jgi:hypothetical protein